MPCHAMPCSTLSDRSPMDPVNASIMRQIALSSDHLHCEFPEHATAIDIHRLTGSLLWKTLNT